MFDLQLIKQKQIEIKDINIRHMDQYLEYLDKMKRWLEIASEFIAMASHLTYIKAKHLAG